MNLKELFDRAPKEYGIYPIIHDKMDNFGSILEDLANKGFAGVAANIKYDREYPDNKQKWRNFNDGCRAFIEKGMKIWIYDEHGYPSGTAGGAVLDRFPQYENLCVMYYPYWKTLPGPQEYRADIPPGKLYKAYLTKIGSDEYVDISGNLNSRGTLHFDISPGAWKLAVFVVRPLFDNTHSAHSYSEPRRYIDLFNKKATEAFLDVTHEKYKNILGDEFGKGIKAFFTDEPSLQGSPYNNASYPILSWSDEFPALFKKKYGYEAGEALLALFTEFGKNTVKKCCDFWELQADLAAENFFGVIQEWCRNNNVSSSGHLLVEEELIGQTFSYGSYYRCAKKLDCPGIDQLESEPNNLMNTFYIPAARLASSIADVYDLKETFSEASDHWSQGKGRQISMDWIRASMNWHFAMGINNITSYYRFGYFEDREIKELNRYTARLGSVLRKGVRYSRTAVLYPECAMWASVKPTCTAWKDGGLGLWEHGQGPQAKEVQRNFASVSWELLHRQIDFDYIDENEICNGAADSGLMSIRKRKYECIVLPCSFVMTRKGIEKIIDFLDGGGKVICSGRMPEIDRETGEDFTAMLLPYLAKKDRYILVSPDTFDYASHLLPKTIKMIPDNIMGLLSGHAGNLKGKSPVSENILSHVRIIEEEDGKTSLVIFLCNMGNQIYSGTIEIEGVWRAEKGCPRSGTAESVETIHQDNLTQISLSIKPYEGIFYMLK
jgi:hypothetical protein